MFAQEFDTESDTAVEQPVKADHLTIPMRPPQLENQNQADNSFGESLIKLRGMQRDPQRHAGRGIDSGT